MEELKRCPVCGGYLSKPNFLLYQANERLGHLLEFALEFSFLITEGDEQKTETYRKIMHNKCNALKMANVIDFEAQRVEKIIKFF